MPVRLIQEHRLADEERRMLRELISILNRLVEDPNVAKIAQVSRDSDKMEVEAKNLQDKLNKTGD